MIARHFSTALQTSVSTHSAIERKPFAFKSLTVCDECILLSNEKALLLLNDKQLIPPTHIQFRKIDHFIVSAFDLLRLLSSDICLLL